MVLIFDPKIKDVKIIKIIGIKFIENKNNNILSLKLILNLIFLISSQIKKKNGIKIPICFNIKVIGYIT